MIFMARKSTIYSSYQANYDNFLNTKRPRVLHVSTHGDYLDMKYGPMDRGIYAYQDITWKIIITVISVLKKYSIWT